MKYDMDRMNERIIALEEWVQYLAKELEKMRLKLSEAESRLNFHEYRRR